MPPTESDSCDVFVNSATSIGSRQSSASSIKTEELCMPSKLHGTILALHGGHLEPELLTIPIPFKDPTFSNGAMVFPEPPTLEHGESMKMCVENGWHTVHFNKGLLRSQVNSGTPFIQGDKKQCFSPLLSEVVIARKSDCTILRDVASSSCILASVPLRSLCLAQKPPLHVVRVSMQVAELLVKGCTKRLGVAGVQLKGNILGGLDEFPGRQWLRSTRKAFARENVQIAVRDHGYDDPWSKRFKIPNDYRPVSKGVFMKGGHPHDPVTIINSYACSHHLRSKEQVQVKLEDVFSCMLPEDPDIVYMVRECAPEPPCCTVLYDSMLRIDAVAMALERREIAEWAQKAEQFFKMLLGSDTWKQSS